MGIENIFFLLEKESTTQIKLQRTVLRNTLCLKAIAVNFKVILSTSILH